LAPAPKDGIAATVTALASLKKSYVGRAIPCQLRSSQTGDNVADARDPQLVVLDPNWSRIVESV
jgi:hypothetical protein